MPTIEYRRTDAGTWDVLFHDKVVAIHWRDGNTSWNTTWWWQWVNRRQGIFGYNSQTVVRRWGEAELLGISFVIVNSELCHVIKDNKVCGIIVRVDRKLPGWKWENYQPDFTFHGDNLTALQNKGIQKWLYQYEPDPAAGLEGSNA